MWKYIFMVILFVFSGAVSAESGVFVPLVKLVSEPDDFDGKRVNVSGYLMIINDRGIWKGTWLSLYENKFDFTSAVRLDLGADSSLQALKDKLKNGEFYRVVGRFHSCKIQHEMCALEISELNQLYNGIRQAGEYKY